MVILWALFVLGFLLLVILSIFLDISEEVLEWAMVGWLVVCVISGLVLLVYLGRLPSITDAQSGLKIFLMAIGGVAVIVGLGIYLLYKQLGAIIAAIGGAFILIEAVILPFFFGN